ncbi:MAG: endonuclease/exonuclease/phosphatase family protein [Bacteroidota bacterium]
MAAKYKFYNTRHLLTAFALFFCINAFSQNARILLDETYEDWQNLNPTHSDPLDDQPGSFIDFGNFWAWNDSDHLFLRIELGDEINLQDNNAITVFIDTDNNASTGFAINGIGADLGYSFGNREGTIFNGISGTSVNHADIGLVSSPTVTSTEFELAISTNILVNGQPLFSSDDIRFVWRNNALFGDVLPNENGSVLYNFIENGSEDLPQYSIEKLDGDHLRILSYNVLFDGFFDPGKVSSFTRILQAVQPDIIGFQEIYGYSSQQTANQVESMLPSGPGEVWFHGKAGPDVIVVSRYPVTNVYPISGVNQNQGNGAFLLDLSSIHDTDLLLLNAHTPCCDNDDTRQEEIDAMMAFVRDAKSPGGLLTLEEGTPIVVLGDMNLVGLKQQQTTLLTGDIVNESPYGNDFQPDWDNSAFEDAKPYTTGLPMSFTWYRENSDFSPGRLDYIVYSGSVMSLENSYVLFTPGLPADSLGTHGLLAFDATTASDHLPVVADFEIGLATSVDELTTLALEIEISPNPVSELSKIRFTLDRQETVALQVVDIHGRVVQQLIDQHLSSGQHVIAFDPKYLVNGVYFVRLQAGSQLASQKVVIAD